MCPERKGKSIPSNLVLQDVMTEFYTDVGKKHKAVMQLTDPWWTAAQEGPAKDRLQRVVSHSRCACRQKFVHSKYHPFSGFKVSVAFVIFFV
jgi:hypothetical protein